MPTRCAPRPAPAERRIQRRRAFFPAPGGHGDRFVARETLLDLLGPASRNPERNPPAVMVQSGYSSVTLPGPASDRALNLGAGLIPVRQPSAIVSRVRSRTSRRDISDRADECVSGCALPGSRQTARRHSFADRAVDGGGDEFRPFTASARSLSSMAWKIAGTPAMTCTLAMRSRAPSIPDCRYARRRAACAPALAALR